MSAAIFGRSGFLTSDSPGSLSTRLEVLRHQEIVYSAGLTTHTYVYSCEWAKFTAHADLLVSSRLMAHPNEYMGHTRYALATVVSAPSVNNVPKETLQWKVPMSPTAIHKLPKAISSSPTFELCGQAW